MKNKFLLEKRFVFFIFFLLIVISLIYFIRSEQTKEQKEYYNQGLNVQELLEQCTKNPLNCDDLFNPPKEHLLNGILDSIDPKKAGSEENAKKNLDALSELWLKKSEGEVNGKKVNTNIFDDTSKNKLMDMLKDKDKKNDFIKKLANSAFWKKYNKASFENPDKLGIKEVSLNGNLKWEGNKLYSLDKENKPASWIDFENIPLWMNKFEFSNGEITAEFFTGKSNKEISFNGGTIGEKGEVIGPDGKVVGILMDRYVKKVEYDNENQRLAITYFDFNKKEYTVYLKKENLPESFKWIPEKINDPVFGPYIKKILSELNGIGVDTTNGQTGTYLSENQLNALYQRSSGTGKTEKIKLNYDGSGQLKLSLENDATVSSVDSKGNVLANYNQFYSAEGKDYNSNTYIGEYNKKHPDSKITDEKAEFVFALDGTVKAAMNGAVSTPGFGTLMTSRENLVGVDIVRNPYVDALVRKDYKQLTETAARETYSIMERLVREGKLDPTDLDALGNVAISESTGFLRRNLDDPSFGVELKKELNKAIQVTLQNIEESRQNIADFITSGANPEQRNVAQEFLRGMTDSVAKEVADQLLDPQKVTDLINGDEKTRQQIVMDALKIALKNNQQLETRVGTDLVQKIAQGINGNTNSIDLSKIIDDAFKKLAEGSDSKTNLGTIVRDQLDKLVPAKLGNVNAPILSDKDKDNLANAIQGIATSAETFFKSEVDRNLEQLKKYSEERGKEKTEYSNRAVIDMKNKEVVLIGSEYISFNAEAPLKRFTAVTEKKSKDEEGDGLVLLSNGNHVAHFKGNEIFVSPSDSPSNAFSIDSITTKTNPDISYSYENNGYGSYVLSNQKQTVSSSYQITGFVKVLFFQLGFPIVYSDFQNPVGGDVGLDPNTEISIQNVAGMDKGRIFNAIMRKQLIKQYGTDGIPLGSVTPRGEAMMNNGLGQLVTALGGDSGLAAMQQGAGSIFKWLDDNNVNLPGGELVNLPGGVVAGGDVRDFYTLVASITKDSNGNYYIPDAKKLLDFFGNHVMRQGSTITFTNNYIEINGDRLTSSDVNPALFRTLTRNLYYNRNQLSKGVRLK